MKISKITFVGAIILSSLLPSLTAQQTTTLNEITKIEREKELERRKVNHQLANPENKSAKNLPTKKRQSQTLSFDLSEEEEQTIRKKLMEKKADLSTKKADNSLKKNDVQKIEKEINELEKALLPKKTKSNLPVVESN